MPRVNNVKSAVTHDDFVFTRSLTNCLAQLFGGFYLMRIKFLLAASIF